MPAEHAGEVVQADERVDALARAVVEEVVRGTHVGPERVAAERRRFDDAQDGAERRLGAPGDIAVPHVGGAQLALRGEHEDLRLVLTRRRERMNLEIAEAATEGDVPLAVEVVLVAEEDDLPLQERPPDLGDRVVRQGTGEIDPADLGADRRGQGFDLHTPKRVTAPGSGGSKYRDRWAGRRAAHVGDIPNPVLDGVTARTPLRTAVSRMALLALGLGGLGAALFAIDLATRPPCAPGYVRLVDLEPVGPIIGGVLAGLALIVYLRSRRGSHLKLMLAVTVVLAGVRRVHRSERGGLVGTAPRRAVRLLLDVLTARAREAAPPDHTWTANRRWPWDGSGCPTWCRGTFARAVVPIA